MKEEKKSPEGTNVWVIIIGFFILWQVWQQLPANPFFSKTVKRYDNQFIVDVLRGLYGKNPMVYAVAGDSVKNSESADVYIAPESNQKGIQKTGALGRVIEGPVRFTGNTWWKIDYQINPDGWVKEEKIMPSGAIHNISYFVSKASGKIRVGSILLSIIFFTGIIYSITRVMQIRREEKDYFRVVAGETSREPKEVATEHPKWEIVKKHLQSDNPNEWKLAIIEADIMLGELLDALALPGEGIGDKLKAVEKSDFTNLEAAWEAHKVRNQIAHEGSTFELTKEKAVSIIDLYRRVFEEFKMIKSI